MWCKYLKLSAGYHSTYTEAKILHRLGLSHLSTKSMPRVQQQVASQSHSDKSGTITPERVDSLDNDSLSQHSQYSQMQRQNRHPPQEPELHRQPQHQHISNQQKRPRRLIQPESDDDDDEFGDHGYNGGGYNQPPLNKPRTHYDGTNNKRQPVASIPQKNQFFGPSQQPYQHRHHQNQNQTPRAAETRPPTPPASKAKPLPSFIAAPNLQPPITIIHHQQHPQQQQFFSRSPDNQDVQVQSSGNKSACDDGYEGINSGVNQHQEQEQQQPKSRLSQFAFKGLLSRRPLESVQTPPNNSGNINNDNNNAHQQPNDTTKMMLNVPATAVPPHQVNIIPQAAAAGGRPTPGFDAFDPELDPLGDIDILAKLWD
jgi:hypothetical protein